MRKVLPMSRIREMEPYMDAKVLDYIHEGQIEAFEGFEDFDLIAFDWYDVRSERTAASQMLRIWTGRTCLPSVRTTQRRTPPRRPCWCRRKRHCPTSRCSTASSSGC